MKDKVYPSSESPAAEEPLADDRVFLEAMRDVARRTPVADPPSRPKPPAQARFTRLDQQDVLRESLLPIDDPALLDTGEELGFRRPRVPETLLRKLRRGQFVIDDEIDLHGLSAPQARDALRSFLSEATDRRLRCVRVVHGKARGWRYGRSVCALEKGLGVGG
jgi:DNA-nicking Smr family endonuclease